MAANFTGDVETEQFVKLTIGQENQQTFLVLGWHIKLWTPVLDDELKDAIDKFRGNSKPEPSSPSSSKSSKRASLTSITSGAKDLFTSSSKESNMPEIKLPHEDPAVWSTFLYWLAHPEKESPPESILDPTHLVRCWHMADKYDFANFKDYVMLRLIQYFDKLEKDSRVNVTVPTRLIREVYCRSDRGESKLKDVIAQEIVKSQLFNECLFDDPHHNDVVCRLCRKDEANVREELKCLRPANNPHPKGCALEIEVWADIVKWKRVYREERLVGRLFRRLEKDGEGKAPVWLEFLTSDKWMWVRGMFAGEPE